MTPWTAACQASLSIINSWSFLKLMSIKSAMPSNHLILCHPFSSGLQSFLASGSFPMSQLFSLGGQSIGGSASASASVLAAKSLQSCLTLYDPMDCSTPGFPVHHQLWELAQIHISRVSDANQPSRPLSSPSPPALNLSPNQGLF